MFGIGLPELILILALALIVVGPDKLPDMAKSIAKQLLELKKTANTLKESLQEELDEEDLKRPWEQLEPLSDEDAASLKESPGYGEETQVNAYDTVEGVVSPEDAVAETDTAVEPDAAAPEEVNAALEAEVDDPVETKS